MGHKWRLATWGRSWESKLCHFVRFANIFKSGKERICAAQHSLSSNSLRSFSAHLLTLLGKDCCLLLCVGSLLFASMFIVFTLLEILFPAHVIDINHISISVNIKDFINNSFNQVNIVGDNDKAAAIFTKIFTEPVNRFGVQVVCRFI